MVHALQHAPATLVVQPSSSRCLRSTHISDTDQSSIANPRRVHCPGSGTQQCVALTGQFLPLFGKGVVLWGERAPRRVQADIDSTVVYRAAKLIRDDD